LGFSLRYTNALVLTAVLEFVQLGEKEHKFNGELVEEYTEANLKIPTDR